MRKILAWGIVRRRGRFSRQPFKWTSCSSCRLSALKWNATKKIISTKSSKMSLIRPLNWKDWWRKRHRCLLLNLSKKMRSTRIWTKPYAASWSKCMASWFSNRKRKSKCCRRLKNFQARIFLWPLSTSKAVSLSKSWTSRTLVKCSLTTQTSRISIPMNRPFLGLAMISSTGWPPWAKASARPTSTPQ